MKKLISVLLAVLMCFGVFSGALADQINSPHTTFHEEEHDHHNHCTSEKVLSRDVYSGACGDSLTWTLDTETGVLSISGTGSMTNYYFVGDVPWNNYRNIITSVMIEDTVSNICNYAFDGCTELTTAAIPDSVTSIGSYAFNGCTSLASVSIGNGVMSIGTYAFNNCSSLTDVYYNGSEEQWNTVSIRPKNLPLLNAIIHFAGNENTGSCGDNLAWMFNTNTGALTISGYGNMAIYSNETDVPWYEYRARVTSVTIEDGATNIGSYAFNSCSGLTMVTIPDSVIRVDYSAFEGCSMLSDVYYNGSLEQWNAIIIDSCNDPLINAIKHCSGVETGTCGDNLTWIFDMATGVLTVSGVGDMTDFNDGISSWEDYMENIEAVIIEDGVTSIGSWAFGGAYNLTSVTMGDSLTSIGYAAFDNCSALTSVTIPDSVTNIESYAFYNCRSLSEINVSEGNDYYCSIDGVLFDKDVTELISFPAAKTSDLYTVPECVISIGQYSFDSCTGLCSVIIGNNVTYIGYSAFSDCTSLASVIIGTNVETISDYAFDGCSALTSVVIPDRVYQICHAAFRDCTGLTSVTIGNRVSRIDDSAFAGCTGLIDVYYNSFELQWNEISIQSNNYPLLNANIHFAPQVTGACGDSLTWVLLDSGELTITGVGEMPGYSHASYAPWNRYQTFISSLIIEEGVTRIGYAAFENCTGLITVTIPCSVTRIDYSAFNNCNSLADVYYDGNMAQWNAISIEAYNDYLHNANIHYAVTEITGICGDNLVWHLDTDTGVLTVSGTGAMMDYSYASNVPWYGCKEFITTVIIEDGITGIGRYAFCECSELTTVTLPDSVTSIGYDAFLYCTSLCAITIGSNVTSIGYGPFAGCTSLSIINVSADNNNYCSIDGALFSKDMTRILQYPAGKSGTSYIIPDTVTIIAEDSFLGCVKLSSITIPDSVTNIGKFAFYECTGLTDVYYRGFESFWNAISISSYNDPLLNASIHYATEIIGSCGNNLTWKLDSVSGVLTIIGEGTMEDYSNSNTAPWYKYKSYYTAVLIEDGVTSIGRYAFYNNESISTVTIPNSVTSIGAFAFYNCTGIVDVYYNGSLEQWYAIDISYVDQEVLNASIIHFAVPQIHGICGDRLTWTLDTETSVLTISGAGSMYNYSDYYSNSNNVAPWYYYRTYFSSVIIEDGVTSIGSYAFYYCSGLTSTTIGSSVTLIRSYAFSRCNSLSDIYYNGAEEQWNAISIGSDNNPLLNATIHYLHTHTYGDYIIVSEPTCIATGSKYRQCSECGYCSYEIIPMIEHILGDRVVDTEPTCTEPGSSSCHCVMCDTMLDIEVLEPLGHELTDWIVDIEPTCTEAGQKSHHCERCGELIDVTVLEPLGHDMTDWIVDIEPTCTESGQKSHHCERCGELLDVTVLEPLGHDLTDWIMDVEPTCTEAGQKSHHCERCGELLDVTVLEPLGHDLTDWIMDIEPTCTEAGQKSHHCERCGELLDITVLEPLGHDFNDWIVDKDATVFESGSMHHECARCGYTETETLDRLDIDITENSGYGIVNITVKDSADLQPLSVVSVFVSAENEGEATFFTDTDGRISIIMPVGLQRLSIYKQGYMVRNINITVPNSMYDLPVIGLSTGETITGEVEVHEMTYEEIIAAGIDPNASDNNHVYQYEVEISFNAGIDWESLVYYFDDDDNFLGMGGSGGDGSIWVPVVDYSGSYYGSSNQFENTETGEVFTVFPVSENFLLVFHGEVKWLKEMFDVELLVINNSLTDTLDDCAATLALPAGLSLANMADEEQCLTQIISHIEEGGRTSVHWYVRGDEEGSYDISVDLSGKKMPFEEEFHYTFTASSPIKVYGPAALHMTFEIPDSAFHADEYTVRVIIENVSDKTLYNVSHYVFDIEQSQVTYYSDGSVIENHVETLGGERLFVREFNPGDKLVIEFSSNIIFDSEVMKFKLQQLADKITGMMKVFDMINLYANFFDKVTSAANRLTGFINDFGSFDVDDVNDPTVDYRAVIATIHDINRSLAVFEGFMNKSDANKLKLLKWINGLTEFDELVNCIEVSEYPDEFIESFLKLNYSNLKKEFKTIEHLIEASGDAPSFDRYEAVRTAISIIPIRYYLEDVVVTTLEGSTTEIPYSIVYKNVGAHYFGVENVSKYIYNLLIACIGKVEVPALLQLFGAPDDVTGYEHAVEYVTAVNEEALAFAAKDATGETTFTAWIELADGTVNTRSSFFMLEVEDNETVAENNGIITFTGDGLIKFTPFDESVEAVLHVVMENDGERYEKEFCITTTPEHVCHADHREILVSATENEAGIVACICDICGEVVGFENVVFCSEHTFDEWTEVVAPTCAYKGMMERYCSACGYYEMSFTDAMPHTCDEWEIILEPTCSAVGYKMSHCSECDDDVYEEIPMIPHAEGEWEYEIWPTSTEGGVRICRCAVCGEIIAREEVAPLGTDYICTVNYYIDDELIATFEVLIDNYITQAPVIPAKYMCLSWWSVDYTTTPVPHDVDVYAEYLQLEAGDVNIDGDVNASDALMIMWHALNMIELDEAQFIAADFNGDGVINASDAICVMRKALGIV